MGIVTMRRGWASREKHPLCNKAREKLISQRLQYPDMHLSKQEVMDKVRLGLRRRVSVRSRYGAAWPAWTK